MRALSRAKKSAITILTRASSAQVAHPLSRTSSDAPFRPQPSRRNQPQQTSSGMKMKATHVVKGCNFNFRWDLIDRVGLDHEGQPMAKEITTSTNEPQSHTSHRAGAKSSQIRIKSGSSSKPSMSPRSTARTHGIAVYKYYHDKSLAN